MIEVFKLPDAVVLTVRGVIIDHVFRSVPVDSSSTTLRESVIPSGGKTMERAYRWLLPFAVLALACGGSTSQSETSQSEITGMVDEVWENNSGHTIQYTGSAGVLYTCEIPAEQPKTCKTTSGQPVDEAEISASYHRKVCAASYVLTVDGQGVPRHVAIDVALARRYPGLPLW